MNTNTEPGKMEKFIDDSTIIVKIKAKYAMDDLVNTLDVEVNSENGDVVLNGKVNSQEAYNQAKEIASNIAGVKSVQANLHIEEKEEKVD